MLVFRAFVIVVDCGVWSYMPHGNNGGVVVKNTSRFGGASFLWAVRGFRLRCAEACQQRQRGEQKPPLPCGIGGVVLQQ